MTPTSFILVIYMQWALPCVGLTMGNVPQNYCLNNYGVFTPEQDTDKTNVEPVQSYEAFHTRSGNDGVKGIIGMHRFNISIVVVFLWCENTISVARHEDEISVVLTPMW